MTTLRCFDWVLTHPPINVCLSRLGDSMCFSYLFSLFMWRHFPHVLIPCSSLTPSFFFFTPFNLSFACLISLFAWLSISSAALLCASPFALAFAFSSPFPRVIYQALSFLCVQLSVRGCSTPHALLERRLVKTCTDMYTHNTQYCGDRTFHTVLVYDTRCSLNISRDDEAYWRCPNPLEFKCGTENSVKDSVCMYVCVYAWVCRVSGSKRSWFTES